MLKYANLNSDQNNITLDGHFYPRKTMYKNISNIPT